jgi:lipoate-protein ligase B
VDARGISRHGFALNVNPNMSFWESVVPCGLEGVQMACVADFITPPKMIEIARIANEEIGKSLDYFMESSVLK